MIRRGILEKLEKRLCDAERVDRICDMMMVIGLGLPCPEWMAEVEDPVHLWFDREKDCVRIGYAGPGWTPPRYTANIQAAMLLFVEVCPDWALSSDATAPEYGIDYCVSAPNRSHSYADSPRGTIVPSADMPYAAAHATALCLAIVRAKLT